MKGFPDLPPLWWLASIAVVYLGEWLLPGLHVQSALLETLSWVILAAALCLICWAGVWFYVKKTPIEPHHAPKALIKEGPYRISRNPIYLALVMLTLASAIGHGSPVGLIAAVALWWVLDRRFATPEEAQLRRVFGAQAEAYLVQTRRWI